MATIAQKASLILFQEDDYEFWKRDTPKAVLEIHKELIEKGLSAEDAQQVIGSVWSLAASEYGN